MARGRPSKKGIIVEAAMGLFTQQGYQGTSIDQVVIVAGVSKPTVYSNFPTKLVLWESVLESLTAQANVDIKAVLSAQQALKQVNLVTGWIALWMAWVKGPERLAVYRILLGEQHKMSATSVALFAQFEAVLEHALLAWLNTFDVLPMHFFALKAITKEALLTPALLNQTSLSESKLKAQLDWISDKKAE